MKIFIIFLLFCSVMQSQAQVESQRRIGIYTINVKDKDAHPLNARYKDIVVDKLNIDKNGRISLNIYNTRANAAALKVLDRNGNILSIIKIDGSNGSDTILNDIITKIGNAYITITDHKNRGLHDVRNPYTAEMTEIHNLEIPQGGRIEICKKCTEALVLNSFDILIKRVISSLSKKSSKVFIDNLKKSGIYEKLAYKLMIKASEKIAKFGSEEIFLGIYKNDFSNIANISGEDMIESLVTQILLPSLEEAIMDKEIVPLLAESGAKGLAADMLEKVTVGATSTNILLAKEIAEEFASNVNTLNVMIDQVNTFRSDRKPVFMDYNDYLDTKVKLGLLDKDKIFKVLNKKDKGDIFRTLGIRTLNNIVCTTQGQTSHFGSADYYMDTNYISDKKNYLDMNYIQDEKIKMEIEMAERLNKTIQENPYYEAGTALIEAPADVVLAWGAHPADLDSHMTGPINATSSERFHTSFEHPGNLDNDPNVLLYRDYTDHHSGGANRPEQTRINVTQPGVYNFYVHDYSNQGEEHSTALSNSGAVVSLHSAGSRTLPEGNNLGQKVVEYKVPTNKEGTVWHTFELDTRRNTIKEINQFNNASDPEKVPFNEKSYIK